MADITNVAVVLSSTTAGKITGVTIDVTGGKMAGLNYIGSPILKTQYGLKAHDFNNAIS